MPDATAPTAPPSRRRSLGRAARSLLRVGTLLTVLSLVVLLVSGWATRSLVAHVREHSAGVHDGRATVSLHRGDERSVYVTGGVIAPGEDVPTPVQDIRCTVAGPGGKAVPFTSNADAGRRIGLDTPLARFQVVGSFTAVRRGTHTVTCTGAGVFVAPQVAPASVLARLGALGLSSLGTFAGIFMLLAGALLTLVLRHGPAGEDAYEDDGYDEDEGARPAGADGDWWGDDDEADEDLPFDQDDPRHDR